MKAIDSKLRDSTLGVAIVLTIAMLWWSSLWWLLVVDWQSLAWEGIAVAILIRTFLHTGLFIIAHDAMHRSLIPTHPRWNDRLGALALWCYACLPYHLCRSNHAKHHRYPAQAGDPDFHDGIRVQPWQWYLKFMSEYLSAQQWAIFFSVVTIVSAIALCCQISLLKLFCWWILPLALSSLQLFVFGTYFPHRHAEVSNRHRAVTIESPLWWSFLSCYHFGYHWEHHEHPHTPWYRLPTIYSVERSAKMTTHQSMQNMSK